MGGEARKVLVTVTGDGNVSQRAWAQYMEIACRVAARCTDEELGIIPADCPEPPAATDAQDEPGASAGG